MLISTRSPIPDAGESGSAGSAENVQRLRHEPGVKFALVQSDVYQAFLDQADQLRVLRRLRCVGRDR